MPTFRQRQIGDERLVNIILFFILSIFLIVSLSLLSPKKYGDSLEYIAITESLYRHASPDLRDEDKRILERSNLDLDEIIAYYRLALDDKYYSVHFWMYPLICLPMKFVLEFLQGYVMKAFQLTNISLFIVGLFHIIFVSQLSQRQILFWTLLSLCSPVFWFFVWPHPEVFSFSFVTMSLVYMHRKNCRRAVVYSSMASLQNQPLIFLVFFFWVRGILASERKFKEISLLTVYAMIALIPNIFSFIKFRTPSLVASVGANVEHLSLFRVWEMFFDLNIGLFPYAPLSVIILIAVVLRESVLRRKLTGNLQLCFVLIAMMLACTTSTNWNHGTAGPTRYMIWMLPIVFFIMINQEKKLLLNVVYSGMIFVTIVIQAVMVGRMGGFESQVSYLRFSPLAKFALQHFPRFYNPTPEIFIERSLGFESQIGNEGGTDRMIYYKDPSGRCQKALVTGIFDHA